MLPVTDQGSMESALLESKIMSQVNHKHICRHREMFVEQSKLYIVMDYCEKGDLAQYLERQNLSLTLGESRIWKIFI